MSTFRIATAPRAASAASGPHWQRLLDASGIVTALGAVLAKSCCTLPLLLASVGAGTSLASPLQALTPWRLPLLAIGGLMVAGGWFAFMRGRYRACAPGESCARPRSSRGQLAVLGISTLLLAAAGILGFVEPMLLDWLLGL